MIRNIFFLFLTLYSMAAFSQKVNIPQQVQIPPGSKLIMHTYAQGVQIYMCIRDTKDSSRYVWTLKEPRAKLYSTRDYSKLIGKHYFNPDKSPCWEMNDGSMVIGTKLQQVNAPDSLAIPWLLLKAVTNKIGDLSSTGYIQRIRTNGGKAPILANKLQIGKTVEVAYTAEYLFYTRE
jgi:hypothetical protein